MKEAYLSCLKKLRQFRKSLTKDKDLKRGRLYFSWLETKTEKIQNEKDEEFVYNNVVKYTLPRHIINQYIYNKANKKVKAIIKTNYILKNNKYVFSNNNISKEDVEMLMKYVLFKRGNVVWTDFGFNIGNEFGGIHPAVILKYLSNELFVIPISSKKPVEFVEIEKELQDGKITLDECNKKKEEITEIIELNKINNYRNMKRWARISRMKKISILRVDFGGTIGTLEGKDMNSIAEKISIDFGNKTV